MMTIKNENVEAKPLPGITRHKTLVKQSVEVKDSEEGTLTKDPGPKKLNSNRKIIKQPLKKKATFSPRKSLKDANTLTMKINQQSEQSSGNKRGKPAKQNENLLTDTDIDMASSKLSKFKSSNGLAWKLIFGVCVPLWFTGLLIMLLETLSKYYHNQSLGYLVH